VDHQSNTGGIVWIPFAEDAVAGSTGAASGTNLTGTSYTYTYTEYSTLFTTPVQNTITGVQPVTTNISNADSFTIQNLKDLYSSCKETVVGTVEYWPLGDPNSGETTEPTTPNLPGATSVQQIDLYVPQSGSGTAKFWANTLGFTLPSASGGTGGPACVFQHIVGGALANTTTAPGGVTVEEHNGTPVATDPNGFGPFSVAQWISQRKGHNDRRHTAVVHSLVDTSNNTVSPFSNGNPATGNLNDSFLINREVYSVVSYTPATTSGTSLFSYLTNSVNGTTVNASGSVFCNDSSDILNYGFGLLNASNPVYGADCGAVKDVNRGLVGFPAGS
jgi:hypothetical protein